MSTRIASWLAWSLVVLAVALLAGGISLALMARPFGAQLTYESEADPFSVIVSLLTLLTFSVVGAIIASRQPRNAIGWIFCSIGLVVSLNSLTGGYAEYRLAGGSAPGTLPKQRRGSPHGRGFSWYTYPRVSCYYCFPTAAHPRRAGGP